MGKYIKFLGVGILFGIVLVKSEAVSWYRIFEMFKFQSFHMYGIIGTAVTTGIILLLLSKQLKVKTIKGENLRVPLKEKGFIRYIAGGTIFGLGWALCGACPGPMYILVGTGMFSILIVIAAALLGTFTYGFFKDKLPH
ncbi:YeeE/YedE family protein [Winogradskyella sp.]|nr:YeeE/YedE family protein [Winogradskyella sp.]MDC0006879.1 YeeE/YedE family protein [Winogradskyella sp.]MDC1505728.1 YeeE/YedE family protein [Winogradskyella sp.]